MLEIDKTQEVVAPLPDIQKKPYSYQRVLIGTAFVFLGAAVVAAGGATIKYRLTNLIVEDGLINGRIVRLQAPTNGNIKAFYAQPGVLVRRGQVVAQIRTEASPQEEQFRLQLERSQAERLERSQAQQISSQLELSNLAGAVENNTSQLTAAKQSLNFLKDQLQSLKNQHDAVQGVDVQMAFQGVSQQQAAVDAAVARATSNRSKYQRYQQLLAEGAVSQQQTEILQFDWESAEAEVKQTKAALNSAQASFNATKNGLAFSNQNTIGGTLSDQRSKLLQAIQAQQTSIANLEAQISSGRQQLNKAQYLYKNRQPLAPAPVVYPRVRQDIKVSAPFAGVVYSTEHEQGEQVTNAERIMTLLDCNNLWIETVVRADEASRIDTKKPVNVQIRGYSKTITGEIDLLQPISSIQGIDERSKLMQVQALLPTIPSTLVGQALTRVTVKIPPPPEYTNSQQFCGVGQSVRLTFSNKPFGSN
jgi:multidrug resistance efflux pump